MSAVGDSYQEPKSSGYRILVVAPTAHQDSKSSNRPWIDLLTYTNVLFKQFLTKLSDVAPAQDLTTFAGYIAHNAFAIRNKYYSSKITLWCDELPCQYTALEVAPHKVDGDSGLKEWRDNMLADEAREVRDVLGGLVLLLPWVQNKISSLEKQGEALKNYGRCLSAVNELRERIEDESGRDLATVVVVQDVSHTEPGRRDTELTLENFTLHLEDTALTEHNAFGWEIVSWRPHLQDDFQIPASHSMTAGREEKQGMARIKEVLEQINWTAPASIEPELSRRMKELAEREPDIPEDFLSRTPPSGKYPFNEFSEEELEREMAELHFAVEDQQNQEIEPDGGSGDDLQVEQLTALMSRAAEIKAAGAEMSKEAQAKYAQREIAKLMKDLNIK